MWKYYWTLIKEVPALLWHSLSKSQQIFVLGATAVLLINQEIGQKLLSFDEHQWGVSRWWAALPVTLLAARAMLKLNYQRFADMKSERDALLSSASELEKVQNKLDRHIGRARAMLKRAEDPSTGVRKQEAITWKCDVLATLELFLVAECKAEFLKPEDFDIESPNVNVRGAATTWLREKLANLECVRDTVRDEDLLGS